MKNLFSKATYLAITLILGQFSATAQVPSSLNVQGRVDTPGATLTGTATILRNGSPTDFNSVPFFTASDTDGVFNLTLVGTSSATFAGEGMFTLQMVVGTNTLNIPLNSVAFAFRAGVADTLISGATVQIGALLASSVTIAGNLVVGSSVTVSGDLSVAGSINRTENLSIGGPGFSVTFASNVVILPGGALIGNGSGLTGILATSTTTLPSISVSTINAATTTPFGGISITTNVFIAAGNVGIGTTGPTAKLQVTTPDDSVSPAIFLQQNNNPNTGWKFNVDTLVNGNLRLTGFNDPGTDNDVMTFSRIFGSVGIGTTNPIRKLHLSDTNVVESVMEATDGLADSRKWNFVVNGTAGAAKNFYIRQLNDAGTGGSTRLFIHGTTGNVGIGTIIPQAELDVSGEIRMKGMPVARTATGTVMLDGGGDSGIIDTGFGDVPFFAYAEDIYFSFGEIASGTRGYTMGMDEGGTGSHFYVILTFPGGKFQIRSSVWAMENQTVRWWALTPF